MIVKRPSGILIILEQQCMLNRGATEEVALVALFNQAHEKKSRAYEKSRFNTDGRFTLKHFAGDVTYSVAGSYYFYRF
jgi:myosin heavy subunit